LALLGKAFDRLTVMAKAESKGGKTYWHCICKCGREKEVQGAHLTRGAIRSCGCLRDEANRLRATHGETGTALYKAWLDMKWRCSPNARDHRPYYHDRGISVCDRWRFSYEHFRDDVGPHPGGGLTLDRIDNGRGYEPGNCRWATRSEQNRNRTPWVRSQPTLV
jgi:hypothetical protein